MMKPMHPGFGPAQVAVVHAASATMARNAAMNQMMAQHAHELYGQGMYGTDYHDGLARKKKKTGGRKHGSQGYTKQDVKHLLDLIDMMKPVDREGWEGVNVGYNRYAQINERQDREPENLKKKFMSLVNFKPAGDQEIPEDVRRAKKIHNQIEPQSVEEDRAGSLGEDEDARFRKRKAPEPGLVDLRNWVPQNGGPPSKDQMKMMITQLATHHQHAQAQQQQAQQHLAHQLSMQYLSQQQQHKAIMLSMVNSLAHNTRQLPGGRSLTLPPLSTEWTSTVNAAATTAASVSVSSIKTVLIEEWSNSTNAESLSSEIKEAVLKVSKDNGLSTVKDLIEALDNPFKDLHALFDFKPVEIARLKKALKQLLVVTKEESVDTPTSNATQPQVGTVISGVRHLPIPSHSLFASIPHSQTFSSPHASQMLPLHAQFNPLPPHSHFHPPPHLLNPHQAPSPYSHMQPVPSEFASLPPLPDSALSHALSLDQPFLQLPQSLDQQIQSQLSQHLVHSSLSPRMTPPSSPQRLSIPSLSSGPPALDPS